MNVLTKVLRTVDESREPDKSFYDLRAGLDSKFWNGVAAEEENDGSCITGRPVVG